LVVGGSALLVGIGLLFYRRGGVNRMR